MQKVTIALIAAIAFSPLQSFGQERVLLEPLTKREEADARALNNYFIRKYTFAAKRYRLVKVDFEVLESEGQIAIPLFDDEKMVANFKGITIDHASGGFRWYGELVQDKITVEAILDHVPTVDVAQKLLDSMTDVTILTDLLERDKKSGANLNPVYSFAEAMAPNKPDRYAQRHSNPDYVFGAMAYLRTVDKPAEYRLQVLGMGGPYHILYEVDPSRIYVGTDDAIVPGEVPGGQTSLNNQDGLSESAEERRRKETLVQEINAFRESLGENPHDAIYREKMKQKGMVK